MISIFTGGAVGIYYTNIILLNYTQFISNYGSYGAAVAIIEADKPVTPEICIVTVDTLAQRNEVVWEKNGETDIDYYNIYKETTQAGVYQLIGSQDYEEESLFVDENSNVQQRSYRYKLSAVNNCGVEYITTCTANLVHT